MKTLTETTLQTDHWRYSFAKAIAHAACGHHAAARFFVERCLKSRRRQRVGVDLAHSLAAYMPDVSLALLNRERKDVPLGLCIALLHRMGRNGDARDLLHLRWPEIRSAEKYLLLANTEPREPTRLLGQLNSFFGAYGLQGVALNGSGVVPRVSNLVSNYADSVVQGPLVSVLMAAHNAADRIGVAIDSVLKQTYVNLELIIIDDASCDDTWRTVLSYAAQDHRVRGIRLKENVGPFVAKNVALEYARGEFVTCHDSDDWSHPKKIELQTIPLLTRSDLVGTMSSWVRLDNDGYYYARQVFPLLRMNQSSLLFRRRKVLEKIGIWDAVKTGADSEYVARLSLAFGRAAIMRLRVPLSIGSHWSGSLMNSSHTGYDRNSVSLPRLEYWEAWTRWHIEMLAAGRLPRLSGTITEIDEERQFPVPESINVSMPSILDCIDTAARTE